MDLDTVAMYIWHTSVFFKKTGVFSCQSCLISSSFFSLLHFHTNAALIFCRNWVFLIIGMYPGEGKKKKTIIQLEAQIFWHEPSIFMFWCMLLCYS